MTVKMYLALLSGIGSGLAASPSARAAAIVHYNLDETGQGATAVDSIGGVDMVPRTQTAGEFGLNYGRDSVPAGTYGAITLTPTQASAFQTAIRGAGFTNDSQFVNSTPNNPLNSLTGSRTVTAWINPDSFAGIGRILASGPLTIGTARTGWGFGVLTTGNQRFTTFGRKDFDQTTGAAVQTGVWQHVAATYTETSATSATVQLYLNGELVSTVTGAPTDAANPNATFGLFGAGGGTEPFAGTMDEVWVFNTALSANEIRAVATGAPLPEPSSLVGVAAVGLLALRRRRQGY